MPGVEQRKATAWVLSSALFVASFIAVAKGQSALAQAAEAGAVGVLLRLTASLQPAPVTMAVERAEAPAALTGDVVQAATASNESSPRARRASAAAKPQALFVSAANVLQLAKASARPSGSFVGKTERHPAGLRLVGVTGLGIGLHDGDILIEALGLAPRSSGELIGAIIQARAKRVRYLSGTLWRGGQTLRITVEQPYSDPA